MGVRPGRDRAAAADLAPLYDRHRHHLLVRAARARDLPAPRHQGLHGLRSREHALLGDADLLPDCLPDAQADPGRDRPQRGGHGLQPGEFPLACLPRGHAAPHGARPRQRVPPPLRSLAGRLRHALNPGRKCLSRPADPGLSTNHRPLRPQGRRCALLRPAAPGVHGLPPATLLGRPAILHHRQRQGRRPDGHQERRGQSPRAAPGRVPAYRGGNRLLLRAARLRVDRRRARCEPRLDVAPLPRDFHRGSEGHPRHAGHRGRRDAARRRLRYPARLPRHEEDVPGAPDDGGRLYGELCAPGDDRGDRLSDRDGCNRIIYAESTRWLEARGLDTNNERNFASRGSRLHAWRGA